MIHRQVYLALSLNYVGFVIFTSYLMPQSPRIAILDDYQGVALSSANWTLLKDRVIIDVFRDTVQDEDSLVRRLEVDPF